MGFLRNKQPEEYETSPLVNTAPTWVCETISVKIEDEKFLVKNSDFPWLGPGKNCKTLKASLSVFSAIDNLKNVKLHHMDNDPNMSLWDNFKQNQRPKIFIEKIAIFTRRVPVENVKTLQT